MTWVIPRVVLSSRENEGLKFITHPPSQILRDPLHRVVRLNISLLVLRATTVSMLIHPAIVVSVGDKECDDCSKSDIYKSFDLE